MGRLVIVAYKPKPGKENELLELTKTHQPILHRLGLATARTPVIMLAKDGTVIEVFEWESAEAIQQAHKHPQVLKMWGDYAAVCDYIPLSQLEEASNMFADFTPVAH
jgi:hypothetical protein